MHDMDVQNNLPLTKSSCEGLEICEIVGMISHPFVIKDIYLFSKRKFIVHFFNFTAIHGENLIEGCGVELRIFFK
jgi:hypothetical protein